MFIIQRVKFLTSVRVSKSLHKTFFNLLKKEHNLIPHPTLGNAEYAKFNSSNISDSSTTSYSDNTLDFIKLDRKGKPIIQKTYYESLGVQQNSTKAMIKQNFIQIARRFHPDKHPDSLEFFSHVCVAYETLMDDYKRAAYDDDLLNNSDALFYVKVWKFRINVIYLFM